MKVLTKVLWAIAGIALILAGCMAFFNPLAAFLVFEYICGGALILSGVLSIIAYIATNKVMLGAGWVLADGIISLLLGLLICFSRYNDQIFSITISMALGLWLMFSGVSETSRSFDLKKLGAKGWGWLTAWGIICIICAVSIFCTPITSAIGITSFIEGIALILGGIAVMSRCLTRDIEM